MEPGLSHRPRFRQDLIAELIDDAADSGTRFIDIMNPDSGHVFRLYEVEYSLACGMDGERDVSGIVKWAKEELGLTASTREVQSVIATLSDFGYLEAGSVIAPVAVEPARSAIPVETVAAAAPSRAAKSADAPKAAEVPRSSPAADASPKSDRAPTAPEFELGHAGPPPSSVVTPIGPAADIELGAGILVGASTPVTASQPVDDIPLGHFGRTDTTSDVGARAPAPATDSPAIELPASRPEERPTRHPTNPQPTPHGAPRAGRGSDRPPIAEARTTESVPQKPTTTDAFVEKSPARADAWGPTANAFPAARDERTEPAPAEERRPAPTRPPADNWRASMQVAPQRAAEPEPPRPPAEPPEEPRVSRSVLLLLAAAIVGAAAFVAYKVTAKKSTDHTEPPTVPQPPVAHTPEPIPVEVQKLGTSPELVESIMAPSAAVIEKVRENSVTRGEVVVEFAGHKRIAAEIASIERDIEKRVQPEVATAQRIYDEAKAAGAPAAKLAFAERRLADRQRSLSEKQAKLAAKRLELEKLELRSPTDGTVVAKVAPGTKVAPTDEIAKLTHVSTRTVTFKNAAGSPAIRVILVSTASGRRLPCVVAKVDANGTSITCPLDVAPESTEVTFGGIDTSPPPPVETDRQETGEHIEIDPVNPKASGPDPGVGATGANAATVSAPAQSAPAGQTPAPDASTGSGETAPPPGPPAPSSAPVDPPKAPEPTETPSPPSSGQ